MAAGQAVFAVILEEGFLDQVKATGDRLRGALEQLIPNHDHLFDSVRGMGLMIGIKLKSESRAFVAHLRDNHGLLTVAAGDNVVRILPRSEEHTSELQSLMSISYAVFSLKQKKNNIIHTNTTNVP